MIYILIILAIVGAVIAALYNSLVTLKNKVNEAWADIDTQLKRRYDLIPNLVETVKGYAAHESQTFEKVVMARSAAMSAQSVQEKQKAENMLSDTLKSIFALAENYPELKANQNFLDLQKSLTEIEEHLQMSRRYYNATVRDFNTKIEVFPNNLLAKPLGFTQREFFEAAGEEKQNVKVSFQQNPPTQNTASGQNPPAQNTAPATHQNPPQSEPPASPAPPQEDAPKQP